ncbi:hypothetical protein [uncultured Amaricoccus sp.]|uniref:hypothetical protein n=1 Tax=uncultured Amaricoccus sp. TaxID=339341 RepID=UPI00260DB75F|nr:hypothetical protein [uncultured Amaricoccus sp.]
MTPARLRELLRLAEARKSGNLARLDALLAEVRACEAEIEDAARTVVQDLAAAAEMPMAQLALRQIWADQRVAQARRRMAALEPRVAEARATALQSLGKHAALEKLIDHADRDAAQVRAARAERDAPPPPPTARRTG